MFELPLFPLNTVLFPGMPLRLHVFEERYVMMLQKVMRTNHTFGVTLIKSGVEALGPLPSPYPVGCTARVLQVEQVESGAYQVTAVGDERFRILRMGVSEPYLSAYVESLPLDAHHTIDVVRGVHHLRRLVDRYLEMLTGAMDTAAREAAAAAGIDGEESEPEYGYNLDFQMDLRSLQLPDDPMMLLYLSGALLQLPPSEKQPLLETDTAALLLKNLSKLYRRELAIQPGLLSVSEQEARQKAWWN